MLLRGGREGTGWELTTVGLRGWGGNQGKDLGLTGRGRDLSGGKSSGYQGYKMRNGVKKEKEPLGI